MFYKKPIIKHFTKSEEESFVFLAKPTSLSLSKTANIGHRLMLLSHRCLRCSPYSNSHSNLATAAASLLWSRELKASSSHDFTFFFSFFSFHFFDFALWSGWWLTATQVVLEVVVWWCCGSADGSASLTMVLDLLGYWDLLGGSLVLFIYLFIIII